MTRWKKVYRDLWINRSRTILVILSIAAGVFAIGMIVSTQQALTASLAEQYADIHPADIILETEPQLDDDFVTSMRHMRGVDEAEGRRSLALRISLDGNGDTWRDLTFYAIPDYDDQRLLRVREQSGNWPPEKREVLLERATAAYLGLGPGDEILVKTSQGKKYTLRVAGIAHDLYRVPPVIEGWVYGYVSMDTIRWMGQPEGYNQLYLDASATSDAEIRALANEAEDRIEGEGLPVYQKTMPDQGVHPMNFIIETMLILLGIIAALAMFLSGLLVVNIISALIAQQEKQIGIMKAIGARSWQIIGLYFGMVLVLGLAACLLAIPFSKLGANALAQFVAELINFNPPRVEYTLSALLVQFGVGLIVPLIAAAPSILNGTRVSPARVLSEYGISQVWRGAGFMDAILQRFPRFTRDLLFALRNPFRKRGRLILSLVTLTFAGAIFMGIVNLRASLNGSLDQMLDFWNYDAWLVVDGHVPAQKLVNVAESVPGVGRSEAWGFTIGRYVRPDGSESDNLYLLAPPAGSDLLDPPVVEGHPLQPGDVNSILVSPGLLANEPTIELGGPVTVKIEGREETYRVVGVMQMMGNSTIGYFTVMDYAAYTRHVREPNRSNAIVFTIQARDVETQRQIASAVEKQYDRSGIRVLSNFLISEEREEIDAAFAIIVALLMVMTVVLATVGGLGLMGTMSLNVIERTREIGVMRAFGASSAAVFRIVIVEGLLIGMMSWILAIGFSIPISMLLAREIGLSFMDYPVPASFSMGGILAWALLVVVIAIVASFLPALRAVRLTVTQVLAYE
ncbi:MAG: FtsX-like permease family protein [Anaerolineales bacterium]|nr:FtsX-like permease family protein [Anaerolineales bacterium]